MSSRSKKCKFVCAVAFLLTEWEQLLLVSWILGGQQRNACYFPHFNSYVILQRTLKVPLTVSCTHSHHSFKHSKKRCSKKADHLRWSWARIQPLFTHHTFSVLQLCFLSFKCRFPSSPSSVTWLATWEHTIGCHCNHINGWNDRKFNRSLKDGNKKLAHQDQHITVQISKTLRRGALH